MYDAMTLHGMSAWAAIAPSSVTAGPPLTGTAGRQQEGLHQTCGQWTVTLTHFLVPHAHLWTRLGPSVALTTHFFRDITSAIHTSNESGQ